MVVRTVCGAASFACSHMQQTSCARRHAVPTNHDVCGCTCCTRRRLLLGALQLACAKLRAEEEGAGGGEKPAMPVYGAQVRSCVLCVVLEGSQVPQMCGHIPGRACGS